MRKQLEYVWAVIWFNKGLLLLIGVLMWAIMSVATVNRQIEVIENQMRGGLVEGHTIVRNIR